MNDFLRSGPVIDFEHPSIQEFLDASGWRELSDHSATEKAYLFVRDEVNHSYDACDSRVTIAASDVLRERVGLCYSKSHLLAGLLRGLGIPVAIRYQRLRLIDGYCLHAFNSVWLDGKWHDVDARGNNERVSAEFLGSLAFQPDQSLGEETFPGFYAEPVPSVVFALHGADNALTMALPEDV